MEKVNFYESSFIRVPSNVFKRFGDGLNSTDIVIYLFIASKVDNVKLERSLTSNYISKSLGISKRTVTNSIARLSEYGYVGITNQYRPDGGRAANLFTLLNIE